MTMPSRTKAARSGVSARALRSRAHLRLVPQPVTTRCDAVGAGSARRRDAGVAILAGLSLGWQPARALSTPDAPGATKATHDLRYRPRRPILRTAAPASASLRLTRRGRLALLAFVTVILALAALTFLRPAAALPSAELVPAPRTVTVSVLPGQSLWEIARQYRPGVDPRDAVIELREANNLTGSQVHAGQELIVPLG